MIALRLIVLALLGGTPQQPAEPATLRLTLDPRVEWITPTLLKVHYELTNPTGTPLYVAQFPGPSMVASCATTSGGIGGSAGGVWSRDGTLARKYYIQLAPGEALMGDHLVEVSASCRNELRILGVYRAEDSPAWGLSLARGSRFHAEPLAVDLRRRPPQVVKKRLI